MCHFRFGFPALRRDQVGIAGILAAVVELRLGQKVVETDLPDSAAQLQADVPILRRAPSESEAALGAEEFARRLVVVDAVERRMLAACRDLEVKI